MPQFIEKPSFITLHLKEQTQHHNEFVLWQSKLNAAIAAFPGFVSLEFLASNQDTWTIVQRFKSPSDTASWRSSKTYSQLIKEVKTFVVEFNEDLSQEKLLHSGVTEVFITQVAAEKEKQFQKWMAKIHEAEAKFPGFRGLYVQSPNHSGGSHWITFLQFDTPENLDLWLDSEQRQNILKESTPLISALESHRVISPYAGWFASIAKVGEIPAAWKQSMVVLLVLFPIVMLEMWFLNPWLKGLNLSLATFIGNFLSVGLLAWPCMPLAIRALKWWLLPKPQDRWKITLIGFLLILCLYALEVIIFWS